MGEGAGDGGPSGCKGVVTEMRCVLRTWRCKERLQSLEGVGGEKLGGRGKVEPDLQGDVSVCARGSFEPGTKTHADVEMVILQEVSTLRGRGMPGRGAWGSPLPVRRRWEPGGSVGQSLCCGLLGKGRARQGKQA